MARDLDICDRRIWRLGSHYTLGKVYKDNQLELACKGGEVETFQQGNNWWAALTRLGKICQARRDTNNFFFCCLDLGLGYWYHFLHYNILTFVCVRFHTIHLVCNSA